MLHWQSNQFSKAHDSLRYCQGTTWRLLQRYIVKLNKFPNKNEKNVHGTWTKITLKYQTTDISQVSSFWPTVQLDFSCALRISDWYNDQIAMQFGNLSRPVTSAWHQQKTFYKSRHRRCSVRKVFLKISQNLQENTCVAASFLIKLQALLRIRLISVRMRERAFKFIKKETLKQVFSCEFC